MGLLSAPLGAASMGVRALQGGIRVATLPARAGLIATFATYEELLDLAERAALIEPPDPPAQAAVPREPRRPAA